MPVGGGVAIVLLNLAGWAWWTLSQSRPPMTLWLLCSGGLLVAGVSAIDDLSRVPYQARLLVHAVAAAVVTVGIGYWHAVELPVSGTISLGVVGAGVTLLWIVGLINAYNFLDGLDGMAASQAVTAGVGWLAIGWFTNHAMLIAFGALLAASSLGFLVHNWHPARVFMGDVGSTFLGYTLAVLPIVAVHQDARFALVAVLLVRPALFDSTFTVFSRLLRGQNVLSGHRTFLFHRLIDCGWSHSAATSLYATFPIVGAGLAFSWQWEDPLVHGAVALILCGLCVALWALVRHEERRYAVARQVTPIVGIAQREEAIYGPRVSADTLLDMLAPPVIGKGQ